MRVELTIPTDRAYVERLFDCLDKIEGRTDAKHRHLRNFIMDEFRRIRAKYNGNPRLNLEAIIEREDNSPMEKLVYQNSRLDKCRVARFDQSIDNALDKVAKIIQSRKDGHV
jgi:hypothetical protein